MHPSPLVLLAACAGGLVTAQNALWYEASPPAHPGTRWDCAAAYDAARDRVVVVSGIPFSGASTGVRETWEFDGDTWIYRGAVGPFGPEGHVRMAYDSARAVTVAVWTDSPVNETWEWDGATWTQRVTPNAPSYRSGFALAYDSIRGRTVLFGGRVGTTYLAETWEWDGNSWTQVGNGGPPPREYHAMAFDAARGETVLFGGFDDATSVVYGDTWKWDGSSWQQPFGIPGPAQRSNHAMVYDSARERVVLVGGRRNLGGFVEYQETWEWDGTAWTNMATPAPVPSSVGLAFDSLRERVVLFGGRLQFSNIQDGTHLYAAPAAAASWTSYGAGCPGPAGTPTLTPLGSPPRLGATIQVQLSQLPSGPLHLPFFWLGFDDAQWSGAPLPLALGPFGFPGCQALLAPTGAYVLSNTGSAAVWSTQIQFVPAFAGTGFFLQGGVLVLGFNPGGLVFSNAVAGVVGG